jgi:hypothetical protein
VRDAAAFSLCYNVPMSEIPRNPYRKRWVNEKGEIFQNMLPAGAPLATAESFRLPTAQQTKSSLLRIRRTFKISRAQLAASLGVGVDALRSWESSTRSPSTAARRLVQLIEAIFFSKEVEDLGFGAIMIGHINLEALKQAKRELLPASAHRFLERFERVQAARTTREAAA